MRDDTAKPKKGRRQPSRLIEFDAWLDSTLWRLASAARAFWETATIWSRKLRVRGFRRFVFEMAGEGMTLGLAGFVVLLALAQPAMHMTAKGLPKESTFSVQFLDRRGEEIGFRGDMRSASVPIEDVSDNFIKALLATEDRRFFEHWGIDFIGLARAMSENARAGGVVQGGSTLTQQLAKNLFLTNERTLDRKINEAFISLWLETHLSKREILSIYLDRAYMGGGTFGAAAAAEFYFDKNIRNVSLAEGAMLAGLFKAPARYAPHINLPAARARANEVLSNMVQAGFLTEGQVFNARRNPATAVDRTETPSPDYFLDYAFEQVQEIARTSPKVDGRSFVARTTVDSRLQKLATESVEYHLRQHGATYKASQASMVAISDDGGVRAMVGGRDYGESQFNRAANALRQPGSSFKVFVYAAAMQAGMEPDDTIMDTPINIGGWSPQNYGRSFHGRVTLRNALARSLNVPAVRLSQKVGMDAVTEMAHAMGVESDLRGDKTMALGTSEVTVLDQATAYNTLVNGGVAGSRHAISQLYDGNGKLVWDFERDGKKPRRVLSEEATKNMNDMLVDVVERGTARRAMLDGIRAGGKTGTTQSYRDGWFVGYTGNFTGAVWFGNDDFSETNNLTGGSLPAMTWKRFMQGAHKGLRLRAIPYIDDPFPKGQQVAENGEDGPDIAGEITLTSNANDALEAIGDAFETMAPLEPEQVASRRDAGDEIAR